MPHIQLMRCSAQDVALLPEPCEVYEIGLLRTRGEAEKMSRKGVKLSQTRRCNGRSQHQAYGPWIEDYVESIFETRTKGRMIMMAIVSYQHGTILAEKGTGPGMEAQCDGRSPLRESIDSTRSILHSRRLENFTLR